MGASIRRVVAGGLDYRTGALDGAEMRMPKARLRGEKSLAFGLADDTSGRAALARVSTDPLPGHRTS
jgi:hypothetical protein